jgi:hypothetical protein
MKIIYRISDSGYNKVKPRYINNRNCLWNAINVFKDADWSIIADNISEETDNMLFQYVNNLDIIEHVSVGHGAGTFNIALDEALGYDDNEIVYFCENDYLHKPGSQKIIEEGLNEIGADFVSLYDHPDKYIDGANPYVQGGGEMTRVMLSTSSHWKVTNSTTMTFAAKVKTLRKTENVLREYTQGSYPRDFDMFISLYNSAHYLVTPIPGYSTHGETAWLTPLIDWSRI